MLTIGQIVLKPKHWVTDALGDIPHEVIARSYRMIIVLGVDARGSMSEGRTIGEVARPNVDGKNRDIEVAAFDAFVSGFTIIP